MNLGHYYKNKRILITGASSGIGKALAIELSGYGACLILCGRNQQRLNALSQDCGEDVELMSGDLLEPSFLKSLTETCQKAPLDMAILNAGTAIYIDAARFQAESANQQMRENFNSMTNSIECVLPSLLNSNGHLVLMSSLSAYGGLPRASAYGASKAAIRNLAQSLDLDLRTRGVPVTCVCPGFVKTPLTDKNDFAMPFLIDSTKASTIILKGLAKQKHEIHFPNRFSLILKVLMSLPSAWQYRFSRLLTKN